MSKKIVIILTKEEYIIVKNALNLKAHKYPEKWNNRDKALQILNDISNIKMLGGEDTNK
tara:strand:+ start:109 stop:285 length:177 start_codon:yes stop_codon:yes gene_type:complete